MKYCLVVLVGMFTFIGCAQNIQKPQKETMESVEQQISQLRKMIIPPEGTTRADVEAIYGTPKKVKEAGSGNSSDTYFMYWYELLPPDGSIIYRVYLSALCFKGQVRVASLNHICVTKGRPKYREGSPEEQKQKLAVESEQRQVLEDLKEIYAKFGEKLKQASWNK